jgi:cell division septation protein DedD
LFTFSKRKGLAVTVGAAVVATGLTLAFGASSAGAQSAAGQAKPTTVPGDNGDVKIHNSTTPVTDQRNEPHVCIFYLDAFNFDAVQSVTWWITAWPPTGDGKTIVDQGTITLDSSGNGFTDDQTLPNGHYKLFWTFAGEKGAAKHKVFWVSCPGTPPTSPPPTTMTPPPTTMTPPPTTMTPPPTTMPPTPTMTSPTPTTPTPPPPAPAPTPVQGTLPVTG